jgi:hypothetical protein
MASISSPSRFEKGDIVTFNGQICIVNHTEKSTLGFSKYNITNVDSGETHTVAKHQLSEIEIDCTSEIPEMDWDLHILEETKPSLQQTRHAVLSESDIDSIAKERLSANTEYQTRWAVSLFKGNYIINVYTQ